MTVRATYHPTSQPPGSHPRRARPVRPARGICPAHDRRCRGRAPAATPLREDREDEEERARAPGTPVPPLGQDGELLHTSDRLGTLFAVTRDESATFFGKPDLRVTVTDLSAGRVFTLDRWNQGAPAPREIARVSPLRGPPPPPPPPPN